ncbi:phosphatidylserine decarboxylase [Salipaludibacillus sp. CF4.18]|uniref:phosphatidylserine decarboxylase n=1 Tax=Salipaludibacillus sp. CF4.18 TaxID=3373081 RepID=UPI003EE5B40D
MKKEMYKLMLELTNNPVYSRLLKDFVSTKLSKPFVSSFAKVYGVNLGELAREVTDYPTLGEFFTRELKTGVRALPENENEIVSPVDGVLTESGKIGEDLSFHVKGKAYSLKTLLGIQSAINRYEHGDYFVFYLSPKDYHRIHSPFSGKVVKRWALGKYSEPVNEMGKFYGKEPLASNYRLITELTHQDKRMAMVKVGALNVNSIHPTHAGKTLDRGEEVAYFSFGSSIVLLFEPDTIVINEEVKQVDVVIKHGQSIGRWKE